MDATSDAFLKALVPIGDHRPVEHRCWIEGYFDNHIDPHCSSGSG